jgi:hypothetical protein
MWKTLVWLKHFTKSEVLRCLHQASNVRVHVCVCWGHWFCLYSTILSLFYDFPIGFWNGSYSIAIICFHFYYHGNYFVRCKNNHLHSKRCYFDRSIYFLNFITFKLNRGRRGPDSWIYNYMCNQCLSPLKLWVRIQLMARCIHIWRQK